MRVDEVAQVVAGHGLVVVELAGRVLGRRPVVPAVGLVEDVGVGAALERGLVGAVLLEPVEVLQEEEPRRLLGVVELGGAARLFPEHVVDVLEGLLEHAPHTPGSRTSPPAPDPRRVRASRCGDSIAVVGRTGQVLEVYTT